MAEVLVFLADGSEEIESVSAINILRRGGVFVKTVSITGSNLIVGSRDIKLYADLLFHELDGQILNNVKMLVFPGGMGGYESFKNHPNLTEVVKNAIDSQKYVAAICAAPSFLGEKGFLNGVKATCYPGFEKNLTGYVPVDENVIVDGNFITGKGPGFSIEFALKLLFVLKGQEVYDKVKAGLLL